MKKTHKDFVKQLEEKVGQEFIAITTYEKGTKKMTFKHSVCGKTFERLPVDIIRPDRKTTCPHCQANTKKTEEKLRKDIKHIGNNEFVLKSKYINDRSPITLYHKRCKKTIEVVVHDFLKNGKCRYCSQSKNEKITYDILEKLNLNFNTQKQFDDCIYKNKLRFDFVVYDDNEKIHFLIEIDGRQHFEVVEHLSEHINITQLKDKIKNNYCRDNNILLLRIPYTQQKHIEVILNKFLHSDNKHQFLESYYNQLKEFYNTDDIIYN